MAHYKRKRPRTFGHKSYNKWKERELERQGIYYYWMGSWPRWWDIVFHRRPHRRKALQVTRRVFDGRVDADAAVWPLDRKPHQYYW